jgi:hypothetical protein
VRRGIVLALLVFVALPSIALGAQPKPWPSAADIRAYAPTLGVKDSVCIARSYRGKLSRKGWLTPYYKLTPKQKLVTDAGFTKCMKRAARVAFIARQEALFFGKQPQIQCVARAMDSRSPAARLAMKTLAKEILSDDQVYRRCGFIGGLFATLGHGTKLDLTAGEQRCTNRLGSAEPFRRRSTAPTTAQRKAIGAIYDRCVGQKTENAMWRALLAGFKPAAAIPCVARHSLKITFVTLMSDAASLETQAKAAAAACLLVRPTS